MKLSDLKLPEGVTIVTDDLHQPILTIASPRTEVVAVAAEEVAAVVEPEVIGKGKKPEEAAEAEGAKKAEGAKRAEKKK